MNNLPFFSGMEFISFAKQYQTPIYLMGNVLNEERMIEAYNLGVQDYVIKPFSPFILAVKMENNKQLLKLRKII